MERGGRGEGEGRERGGRRNKKYAKLGESTLYSSSQSVYK